MSRFLLLYWILCKVYKPIVCHMQNSESCILLLLVELFGSLFYFSIQKSQLQLFFFFFFEFLMQGLLNPITEAFIFEASKQKRGQISF